MKSKIVILALLLLALPALAQAQCISSGGQISCVIPGATIAGSGTSQIVALPGKFTVPTTNAVTPAIGSADDLTNSGFSFQSSGGNAVINAIVNGHAVLKFGPGSLEFYQDNTINIGTLTTRAGAVNSTNYHSGATAMTFATSSGDITALSLGTNQVATFASEIAAGGDVGGSSSHTTLTSSTNTTTTNAYVVGGGQAATTRNTGWAKIYIGTTTAWVPYWANATP